MGKKNNGDIDAACAWLKKTSANRSNKSQEQPNESERVPIELHQKRFQKLGKEFASQVIEMNQRGFDRPKRNLIALKKHNGDVDAACAWLEKTSPRKDQSNDSQPLAEPVAPEMKGKHFQELAEKYSVQLVELNQRGFDQQPRRKLTALEKHNGNVDAACAWLEKTSPNRSNKFRKEQTTIQPAKNQEFKGKRIQELATKYASELGQMTQLGFHQSKRNLIALKKHDGDVQAACTWLNKKQNKPKKDSPDFNQLLVQLHAKGFYNDRKNLRLLHKAEGNVSLVLAQLESETIS